MLTGIEGLSKSLTKATTWEVMHGYGASLGRVEPRLDALVRLRFHPRSICWGNNAFLVGWSPHTENLATEMKLTPF